jgi:hypothetical protein
MAMLIFVQLNQQNVKIKAKRAELARIRTHVHGQNYG